MKESDRYEKIVEWSEEDQVYVGRAPGLIYGGCHGTDERAVFDELCQIVDEAIALYRENGKPLPLATSHQDFASHLGRIASHSVMPAKAGIHANVN
jgi:predicted RNase H-like HicB family nuclease